MHSIERAVIGGGCFWCLEAVYQRLNGVVKIQSGYSGGTIKNPSYKEVCTGTSGHAEVVVIDYDSTITSFTELLEVFWVVHDPTTLNRQGNDKGTQYRSVIFSVNKEQQRLAQLSKKAAAESALFEDPIVTEISPLGALYIAEDYHQNYANNNPQNSYCHFVVKPKVDKFKKLFKDKLKGEGL